MGDISRPLDHNSSAFFSCTRTGGDVFVLSDLRAIPQYVEAVNSKCRHGVVIDLVDMSGNIGLQTNFLVPKESVATKQLILLRENFKNSSFWPIPESFWPSDDLLTSRLVCSIYLTYVN